MHVLEGCLLLCSPFPWDLPSQLESGFCSSGEVWDVAAEVVQHSIKPLYFFHIPRSWPVSDCCTLGWVMFQTVVGDLHPKEDDLTLLKLTLTESETQPIFSKFPQDLIHPIPMCCHVFCEYDNIIDIGPDMSSCNLLMQHMVHEPLEGGWSILQSKPHDGWFEESTGCQESTTMLVLWPDLHGWESSLCIDF